MDLLRIVSAELDQLGDDARLVRSTVLKEPRGAVVPQEGGLVLTKTTLERVNQVVEGSGNPIPLLLHGGTGCGKSACVLEAARRRGATCVRLNLSNRTCVDHLVGTVTMSGRATFTFVKGQFMNAYEQGQWLLMDEVNLASDAVLQVIESALDTGFMSYIDSLDGGQVKIVPRHPDFRLFATANPGTGFFKNKREVLSSSFLSRFVHLVFHDLPTDECVAVVHHRLQGLGFGTDARAWAESLVHFHSLYSKSVSCDSPVFVERTSYAQVSIRELLKFVDHLGWFVSSGGWSRDPGENDMKREIVSMVAWSVYGARFRSSGGDVVRNLITRSGWPIPALLSAQCGPEWWVTEAEVGVAGVRARRVPMKLMPQLCALFESSGRPVTSKRVSLCVVLLEAAMRTAWDQHFASAFGFYFLEPAWLSHLAVKSAEMSDVEFARLAICSIVVRFRHSEARRVLRGKLLKVAFTAGMEVVEDDRLEDLMDQPSLQSLTGSERPFALTARVLRFWAWTLLALHVNEPVLVVGDSGCGKSECVRALALLLGHSVIPVLLTPESEVQDLAGHVNPADAGGFKWIDGPITAAFSAGEGQWCLLDNLSDADPCVVERLNPLLETPSTWFLSERGDMEPLKLKPNFRVIATMSTGGGSSASKDLTPSLANRFSSVVLSSKVTRKELEVIAAVMLGDDVGAGRAADLVVSFFCEVWLQEEPVEAEDIGVQAQPQPAIAVQLTLRNFVRTVECLGKLARLLSSTSHRALVSAALFVTVRGQLDLTCRHQVCSAVSCHSCATCEEKRRVSGARGCCVTCVLCLVCVGLSCSSTPSSRPALDLTRTPHCSSTFMRTLRALRTMS